MTHSRASPTPASGSRLTLASSVSPTRWNLPASRPWLPMTLACRRLCRLSLEEPEERTDGKTPSLPFRADVTDSRAQHSARTAPAVCALAGRTAVSAARGCTGRESGRSPALPPGRNLRGRLFLARLPYALCSAAIQNRPLDRQAAPERGARSAADLGAGGSRLEGGAYLGTRN